MEVILSRVQIIEGDKMGIIIFGEKAKIMRQCNNSLRFEYTKLGPSLIFFEVRTS